MAVRKKQPFAEVDALLDEFLVDAHDDDEQLTALAEGISDGLDLPLDAYVVGQPVSLVAVGYEGNARRGLVGRCLREDGTEYGVSLADIELSPESPAHLYIAAYCRWLGVEPAAPKRKSGAKGPVRKHKANDDDIDISKPVELVVLAVKERAARCRLPGSERIITLRPSSLFRLVPGQLVTVEPKKHWRHNGHPYLSGKIVASRIDAAALGLTPLALNRFAEWDPAEESWGEEGEPIADWAMPIIARGPRMMWEMEQVLPGADPDDFDSDAIIEANELMASGNIDGAREILTKMVESDVRCLDAHMRLGNMLFRVSPHWALNHYEVGVRIGELSLGAGFDDVLSWRLTDNRPFLQCMEGFGVCLWRLKRWDEAERVFERMLWMNPSDNQGIRFLLPDVRARQEWYDEAG